MAEAYILRNGRVVRPEGWDINSITFSVTTGTVRSFTKISTGIRYIHVNEKDFRKAEQKYFSSGYYPEQMFLEYLSTKDISLINYKNKYENSPGFSPAVNGDVVKVKLIDTVLDGGNSTAFLNEITFNYNSDEYYLINERVKIPTNILGENPRVVTTNTTGSTFLSNYAVVVVNNNTFSEVDQKQALLYLGLTAIVISKIIDEVFGLFPDIPQFNTLIQKQKEFWETLDNNIFTEVSRVEEYKGYFNTVFHFYKTAYRNSKIIEEVNGIEKLFWLSYPMSAKTLGTFTPDSRKFILEYLIDEKLSKYLEKIEEEEYAIRIVNSFAFSLDFSEIDDFLTWLIEGKSYNGNQVVKTFYQELYDRMSSDFNITVATKSLSNWLFESNWKPDDTKGKFVKTVYKLWSVSKYNPYEFNGTLKPNSIGMKGKFPDGSIGYELDPPQVDSQGNIVLSASEPSPPSLYYYTKFVGFRQVSQILQDGLGFDYEDISNEVIHPEASPVLLNYESNKFGGLFDDNFNFDFYGTKITANYKSYTLDYDHQYGVEWIFYGSYKLFQPVTLLQTKKQVIETKIPIPFTNGSSTDSQGTNINSVVPIFMLKYIDDIGDRSDIETMVGYVVDGVLTLSGIGNLTKFRHLTKLSKLQHVKRIIGGVEFTSGVLSYLTSFMNDCPADDDFCKGIKAFTFWLEMASLSADAITEYMLKKAAKNVKQIGIPSNFDDQPTLDKIDELVGSLEKVREIERFLEALGDSYPQLKNKLEAMRLDVGDDIVHELIDSLGDSQDVLKVLDNNPHFLDDIDDIAKATRLARALNIFGEVRRKVELEPFDTVSKKGFSFNKWEDVNGKFQDTGNLLHSDDDILEMIYYGLNRNPEIPDEWIQDILVKGFRSTKPKTKLDIIGNGTTGTTQEALGELGVASELFNRVPPGLLWCFQNAESFANFKDIIKRRLLERFQIDDIIGDIHIIGSVHTKKGPPDIDIDIRLNKSQAIQLYQKRIDFIQDAVNSKLKINGNLLYSPNTGKDLISDMRQKIIELDAPDFNPEDFKFGLQRIKVLDEVNGVTKLRDLKTVLKSVGDTELFNMLQGLNLQGPVKGRMDIKLKLIDDTGGSTALRPETKVLL